MERLKKAAARIGQWWKESFIGRVVTRFGERNGSIFAGGLAYGLLFAFFAGIWSVFSVFGLLFSNNAGFRDSFLTLLDALVPGVASGSDSIINPATLSNISTTFTITGLFTVVVFWWQITNWLGSLRSSVQTIIGEEDSSDSMESEESDESARSGEKQPPPSAASVGEIGNPLFARLIDTAAVLIVAVLFILTTFAGVLSGGMVSAVMRFFGWLGSSSQFAGFLIAAGGFVAAVALNWLLLVVLFRLVCQVRRVRIVAVVAFVGAFALAAIQLLGARLLTGASSNPLLAPFAAILAVLIWFNIIAMILMYCSAMLGVLIEAKAKRERADERN